MSKKRTMKAWGVMWSKKGQKQWETKSKKIHPADIHYEDNDNNSSWFGGLAVFQTKEIARKFIQNDENLEIVKVELNY